MDDDKPKIGRVRLRDGMELNIHADADGAYAIDDEGNRYAIRVASPAIQMDRDAFAFRAEVIEESADEIRKKTDEWTYAAPPPVNRQTSFKDIANRSSWHRHDGGRKHR